MTDWDIKKVPGVHAAPNIQKNPDIYEIENQAADPNGLIETAMWKTAPWLDKTVLDLGAGTGFHLPRFYANYRLSLLPVLPALLTTGTNNAGY